MADPKQVFATKIILNDYTDPVTEDTDIGLYNVNSLLTIDASSGASSITVLDGSLLTIGELIQISDDTPDFEFNQVNNIVGNVITLENTTTADYTVAQNARVDGNSELRWLQNNIDGVTNWKSGIIVDKGIGRFSRMTDLRRGGDIERPGSAIVRVKNTNKFYLTLQDKGINITGLRMQVIEFENAVENRKWSGICNKPSWTSKVYSISARGYHNKRISNLATKVTVDDFPLANGDILNKTVPMSYGNITPLFDVEGNVTYNGYAKSQRTANKEELYVNISDYTVNVAGDRMIIQPGSEDIGMNLFPVVSEQTEPTLTYIIKLGRNQPFVEFVDINGSPVTSGDNPFTVWDGLYLKVAEGAGGDNYKRIESATFNTAGDASRITVTLSKYFEETLEGDALAKATNQSWVNIQTLNRSYNADVWPCEGYLDDDGTVVDTPDLYSFDSDDNVKVTGDAERVPVEQRPISFYKVPQYAYSVDPASDNNKLEIDVNLFVDSPDTMNSVLITKPTEITDLVERELSSLASEVADETFWGNLKKTGSLISGDEDPLGPTNAARNVYRWVSDEPRTIDNPIAGGTTEVTDQDRSTSYEHRYDFDGTTGSLRLAQTLRIVPPAYPKRWRFDNLFLGINYTSFGSVNRWQSAEFHIRYRRFMGWAKKVIESTGYRDLVSGGQRGIVKSDPDFYYSLGNNDTNDLYFYVPDLDSGSPDRTILSDHKNFEFDGVDTEDTYNSIDDVIIALFHDFDTTINPNTNTVQFNLFQIMFMFKKKVSIKNEIYSGFKGRLYDDTWDARKVSTDLMTSPVDILEHFERLGNWSDVSLIPSEGWGREYAQGALIKTTGTRGNYDDTTDTRFTAIKAMNASNQILAFNKGYSDKLKKSICRNFWLAQWYDNDGNSNVATFGKPREGEVKPPITTIITLADITDRSKIKIDDPDIRNIFPELFVNFNKNFANNSREGRIAVTNVDQESYVEGYIIGMSGIRAENLWNRCHSNWLRSKHLEPPPADMTDLDWMNGDDSQELSEIYAQKWADWQANSMISFPVHYNTAKDIELVNEIIVQFPHQTNNVQIEVLVSEISHDPNNKYESIINGFFLDETLPEDFDIKDTWENFGNDNDWKDSYTVFGDDNDILDSY